VVVGHADREGKGFGYHTGELLKRFVVALHWLFPGVPLARGVFCGSAGL
jgi:hypothetical protein